MYVWLNTAKSYGSDKERPNFGFHIVEERENIFSLLYGNLSFKSKANFMYRVGPLNLFLGKSKILQGVGNIIHTSE